MFAQKHHTIQPYQLLVFGKITSHYTAKQQWYFTSRKKAEFDMGLPMGVFESVGGEVAACAIETLPKAVIASAWSVHLKRAGGEAPRCKHRWCGAAHNQSGGRDRFFKTVLKEAEQSTGTHWDNLGVVRSLRRDDAHGTFRNACPCGFEAQNAAAVVWVCVDRYGGHVACQAGHHCESVKERSDAEDGESLGEPGLQQCSEFKSKDKTTK